MRKRVRHKIVKRAIKKLESGKALTYQEGKLIVKEYGELFFRIREFWISAVKTVEEAIKPIGTAILKAFKQIREVRQHDRAADD